MTEEIKEAQVVYVRADYVRCPHCEEKQDGWLRDPRDTEATCDDCGKQFRIAADAEVRMA